MINDDPTSTRRRRSEVINVGVNVVGETDAVPLSSPSLPVYSVKMNLLGKYNGSNNYAHLRKSLAYMWRAGLRGRVLGRQNPTEFDWTASSSVRLANRVG